MELSSTAFAPGGEIPRHCTCEGEDTAPALQWTGVPDQAASLALIVDDPDAPDPAAPVLKIEIMVSSGRCGCSAVPSFLTGGPRGS